MSVYTRINDAELTDFLSHYSLGQLRDYQGIAAGITNTNYFVTTTRGQYVLTLFEQDSPEELPYFLDLMAYLAEHEVPSAHPLADEKGTYLRKLNGKPAALVQRLRGRAITTPNPAQCHALGKAAGHMHSIAPNFPRYRPNPRGPHWWQETAHRVMPHLSLEDQDLLSAEMEFQADYRGVSLPRGVIHADLFRDNTLFLGNELSGIIDFYYACDDVLLYDVAIIVNDWCAFADGSLDTLRLSAFFDAYTAERPVSGAEWEMWPVLLRAAALRFWLSRLEDLHFPRPGEITHTKDPDAFKYVLQGHIQEVQQERIRA
jgi:homoserine kinase type II